MKKYIYTSFLIIIFYSTLNGQTIITGVVADSLNRPIPYATVYLSKTTVGITTGSDGIFLLKIPKNGYYHLVVSCLGYFPVENDISADGQTINRDFKLKQNYLRINEVTIDANEKLRNEDYYRFEKLFLGETKNALFCKILNLNDLHLYRDYDNNLLKGISIKPLKIRNKALGYTIVYDLKDFSYDLDSRILKFSGNYYFQTEKGDLKDGKKWELNRLKAYKGSRMHLIRALYDYSLTKNGFRITQMVTFSMNSKEVTLPLPVTATNIVFSAGKFYKNCFSPSPLKIGYSDPDEKRIKSKNEYQNFKNLSDLIFTDTIKIYSDGFFENPYSITWDDDFAMKRIADLLPYDYWPNELIKEDSDSDF